MRTENEHERLSSASRIRTPSGRGIPSLLWVMSHFQQEEASAPLDRPRAAWILVMVANGKQRGDNALAIPFGLLIDRIFQSGKLMVRIGAWAHARPFANPE